MLRFFRIISLFFKNIFSPKINLEDKSALVVLEINKHYLRRELLSKLIAFEGHILFEHPELKKRELYNFLFDAWFSKHPPDNESVSKELLASVIKEGHDSRQNLLFYSAEIYRIESGIPLTSFDDGKEVSAFYFGLEEKGYDMANMNPSEYRHIWQFIKKSIYKQ